MAIVHNGFVQYENFAEFDKMINSPRVSGRDDSSESSSSGWAGTESFQQSEDFRQYGDEKSARTLKKHKAQVDDMLERPVRPKHKSFTDVVGFQPIIPNALMNLPKTMINQKRTEQKGKVMRIFADMGFTAGVDSSDIAYRGALIMSAVQQLEIIGIRVELWVGVTCDTSKVSEGMGFLIKTKEAMQPLNVHKQAYYVINPSMLRRTYFRFCECENRVPDVTHDGYGSSRDNAERRNNIKKYFGQDMIVIGNQFIPNETSNPDRVQEDFNDLMDIIKDQQEIADEFKKGQHK